MSNGNRYTEEYKIHAICLVKESNRSVNRLAKDLGVNPQTLRNWLKEDKKRHSPDKAKIMELEANLKAEKRRNAELEESINILKKASAIFGTNNRE